MLVDAGWDALERGDWAVALEVFEAAAGSDDPRAQEGRAWASWWSNDGARVFAARERAFKLYRRDGDPVGAARCAIWLGADHHDLRREHAVASGWYQRARRLLTGQPTCPEHGWLAFHEGAYALELDNDTSTALARAAEVASIAEELGHGDLGFLSLALEGLARVTEGEVAEGMRRLDEVGIAATAGELGDRIATAWSLCYLIFACERVRDFERAAQWCSRMQEISTRYAFELGMGVCRARYGGVLVVHGQWDTAEVVLAEAGASLARSRPAGAVESTVRIAELRRRQGRAPEAAALFEDALPHPLAVVGMANLALEAGRPERAAELLDDLLAATPATSRTQRADALEIQARARGALGDSRRAWLAAEELADTARAVGTGPLRAMAARARAAAAGAEGDDAHARRLLEEAVDLYDGSGMPYEAELSRSELARVLVRLGRPESGQDAARVAAGRLRALGAVDAARRAEDAALPAGAPPATAPGPLSPREAEVATLLAEGLSDRELADRLHISAHTAHRHVSNILTKLGVPSRAAAAAWAVRHGLGR